jgi:hypothetical protein
MDGRDGWEEVDGRDGWKRWLEEMDREKERDGQRDG